MEWRFLRTKERRNQPKCELRYVDDTFIISPHGISSLTVFFEYLNTLHSNIKFTMETEKDGVLPFLDVLVKRTNNNKLAHGIYRKKTHTDRYQNAVSHHHPQQKRSIKEHQRHTRLGNTYKSAIAENVHTNENHKIDYENIRVLDKTTRYYPRIIRESLEIMKNNNNFNRKDADGYRLSNTWRLAIPRTSDLQCHGQPSSTDVQPNIVEPRVAYN
ncbi:hypothetical protein NQ318_017866 [Aromia moschata]|uniref:Reverse transcriptase domain-containing protein n=1 Tax=Aromia moschata TaxID=1265417 RepID=A0AAV8XR22_9CUCU|nr:hypothetical protein NQ318_017866 [Aromia moschata]